MWTKSRIFQAVKYVFLVQILALFFFSIIRIAFIAVNFPEGTPFIFSDILHALVIGVRFDNHIASYISLLPLLSAVVISLFKRIKLKGFFRILNCYYYILYTIAFLIAVSNIRYFAFSDGISILRLSHGLDFSTLQLECWSMTNPTIHIW